MVGVFSGLFRDLFSLKPYVLSNRSRLAVFRFFDNFRKRKRRKRDPCDENYYFRGTRLPPFFAFLMFFLTSNLGWILVALWLHFGAFWLHSGSLFFAFGTIFHPFGFLFFPFWSLLVQFPFFHFLFFLFHFRNTFSHNIRLRRAPAHDPKELLPSRILTSLGPVRVYCRRQLRSAPGRSAPRACWPW